MRKQLFQYAVLFHTYEEGKYKGTKVVIEPTFVLAKNDKEVAFKVTREIGEEYISDPENVEIIIRPF